MNYSKQLVWSFWTPLLAVVALTALLGLPQFGGGSILNSDDALYAQVSKEVSQGSIYPLTFSGVEFRSKPPLFFWVSGLAVRIFGSHEWVFRLPSFLSFLALLVISYVSLFQLGGIVSALLGSLLLLSSPMLSEFSQRVMLDIPLSLCVVTAVSTLYFVEKQSKWWIAFWAFVTFGWWMKTFAVLPPVLAALAVYFIGNRKVAQVRHFLWGGLAFLLIGPLFEFVIWLQSREITAGFLAFQRSVLEFAPSKSVYWDVVVSEIGIILLSPLPFLYYFLRAKRSYFFYAMLGQAIALMLSATNLPHYAIPVIVLLCLAIAEVFPLLPKVPVILTFIGLSIVCFFTNRSSDANPSLSTKEAAFFVKNVVPTSSSICAVDTYFVGLRFYSDRETLGIYTSDRAYQAMTRAPELRSFARRMDLLELASFANENCDGVLILPEREAALLRPETYRTLWRKEPLSIIRFSANQSSMRP